MFDILFLVLTWTIRMAMVEIETVLMRKVRRSLPEPREVNWRMRHHNLGDLITSFQFCVLEHILFSRTNDKHYQSLPL